ncbi:MAG: flagellar basal body P-ring protein FlgI [Planctomycetota bacterium]
MRSLAARMVVALALAAPSAPAQFPTARVGDVTHLQGQGRNVLIGYGLVTGLKGTGDGSKYAPTMRAVAEMTARFGAEVQSLKEVEASKNTAMVMVEAVVPENGGREGELTNVNVTALAATSLVGGRLLSTPLVYHDARVEGLFAFASGPIVLESETLTVGVIRDGARLERDVFVNVLAAGEELRGSGLLNPWIEPKRSYLTLVLDDAHAGWAMATSIAQAVDKELSISADVDRVALAVDSKNVVVLVPDHQLGDPASWIRDVERTPILMEAGEARVTINRRAGTIVVTGETRISPVIVSQMGLTVTVAGNAPEGTLIRPTIDQQNFVPIDLEKSRSPNVKDLLEALNRLKVPFKDRVSILEEIHRAGKLHAKLMYEG